MAWIKRIPWWIWLFLALTQAATIIAISFRLSHADIVYNNIEIQHRFDEIRRKELRNVVIALILCPSFFGLAFWRWRKTSSEVEEKTERSSSLP